MKRWRFNLILLFLLLAFAAILVNLARIQIINGQYWSALAQGQQKIFDDSSGERGEIFLEGSSFPVAANKDSYFAYLSPSEITEEGTTTASLGQILDISLDRISESISKKESLFFMLKEGLTEKEIEDLQAANLSGVYLGKNRVRYYPFSSFASNLLGFVGADGNGQYGSEGYFDKGLRGESEVRQGEKGPKGYLFFSDKNGGENINLTIDYNIQFKAEKLLESASQTLKIESGQIIVIDPTSGKLIALAEFPNFDPNNYSEYAKEGNLAIFQNSATQKIYEPGSTFKTFTMAMGLEEQKITPQTTYIDEGFVKFGGRTVYNYDNRTYGKKTMTEVLEKSINTGAVFVEQLIPHETFLDYLEDFGFFEETGINFPEVYSENNELKKGYEINFATCSFGQGIEMTPLQLARAYCSIANGGHQITPYISEDARETGDFKQIISQKTASQLTAMLVSVVENGYAKTAKIPGYYIAGKTGTAQVPERGGYSKDKTIQSFVGFAPAFNPKFLILVKLDNPQSKTAEYSAVPIFHDLAKYIIDYWQISPDFETE